MNKTQLENLIERMNTPLEPEIKVSREMESWKARREAEKLSDTALLPILELKATKTHTQIFKVNRREFYCVVELPLSDYPLYGKQLVARG